jgi:competence protein ComEC
VVAIGLSGAWLLGILAGPVSGLSPLLAVSALVPLSISFLLRRKRKLLLLSGLWIVVFFVGVLHFRTVQSIPRTGDLSSYNNIGVVEIRGHVDGVPETGSAGARIRLSATGIKPRAEWQPVSGAVLLTVPRYPEYRYGDVLVVKGALQGRPPARTASANESSYWEYLGDHEVYSTLYYPDVELVGRGQGQGVLRWLYSAREDLGRTLARVLPEPQASLAQGIVLGMRANIPAGLKTDFVRTGTAHLLAISGVNLTIVAGILVAITLRLLGRRHYVYIWVTLVVVWFYTCLTGAEAPVVRDAIMLTLFLVADLLGRQRSAVVALALAAAIMVGLNPTTLGDASFQLSFAAMAGLVFVFPPLQSLTDRTIDRFLPDGRGHDLCGVFADSLGVSLAAVIATLPLTAYYFGVFSWVGPLATLVTMPVMSAIIVTSILAAATGLLVLAVGQAVAWLAWLPLSYLVVAVGALAAVPGASQPTGAISGTTVIAYYASLGLIVVFHHQYARVLGWGRRLAQVISVVPVRWVVPPLAVIALLAWLVFISMPDDDLHVSFLDVGQGDAVLIERGNRQILIDGGPNPQLVIAAMGTKMPFWDRSLDMVVLTHPDADHLGGLVEVLRRFRVQAVVSANISDGSALFRSWQTAVESVPGRLLPAAPGQRISLGDEVSLSVLSPDPNLIAGSGELNSKSVVIRLAMGDVSFLLTGDLDTETERKLIMQEASLGSSVLKVGHHGSATSTSDVFLAVVGPRAAVISVGKANTYGHPNQEVLSRLTQKLGVENVYRTDERGTIEFITDGARLWVKTRR